MKQVNSYLQISNSTSVRFIPLYTPPKYTSNFSFMDTTNMDHRRLKLLHNTKGGITSHITWSPRKQRTRNIFIMEFLFTEIEDSEILTLINNWRLYLQIFTLAEMASSNGKRLTKCSLKGQQNPSFKSTLKWPKQKRPSNKIWKLFAPILL